jgi:hypothetical protein
MNKGEKLVIPSCYMNNKNIQLNLLKLCNLDNMYSYTSLGNNKIINVLDIKIMILKGTLNKYLTQQVHFYDVNNYNSTFVEKLVENITHNEYLLTDSSFYNNIDHHCNIMVLKLIGKDHLINVFSDDFKDHLNELLEMSYYYLQECSLNASDESEKYNADNHTDNDTDEVATQPYYGSDDNNDNDDNDDKDDDNDNNDEYNEYMQKVYSILKFEELVNVANIELAKIN